MSALRAKTVEGIGSKDANAKNHKKCYNSFKHGLSTQWPK